MNVMIELTDSELDAVAGGKASAKLQITALSAKGDSLASVSATGLSITTSETAGVFNASIAGTFTSDSD